MSAVVEGSSIFHLQSTPLRFQRKKAQYLFLTGRQLNTPIYFISLPVIDTVLKDKAVAI